MKLGEWRRTRGLSLRAVGTLAGLGARAVHSIEHGGRCQLETAARLVAVTGGEVGWMDLLPRVSRARTMFARAAAAAGSHDGRV
jgi:predicted transcriptional regulator